MTKKETLENLIDGLLKFNKTSDKIRNQTLNLLDNDLKRNKITQNEYNELVQILDEKLKKREELQNKDIRLEIPRIRNGKIITYDDKII